MKVNIRYTVDLEEVLQEMSSLYYKSLDKLETNLNIYEHFLRGGFNEMEVDHIITALEHSIKSYYDHQTKVSEILSILKGYQGIKNNAEPQDMPQESDV